ncbi:hypothetical protein GCM10009639_46090 [Kitasatospora putterlickiae]|uniref:Uncharacterized protein n=1 Tax=Kitasatospora putterlickiae TaxID=221725 RepID=A0ABP4J1B1_9ACTN
MGTRGTNDPAVAEREPPAGAAVVITVLAGIWGGVLLLAVLYGLGWTVPGLGWLIAKGAVKLGVAGVVGLTAAVAWLRARRAGRGPGAS